MAHSSTPLHPRPRWTRDNWQSLNGKWEFAYDDADEGLLAGWQDKEEAFTRSITVPFAPESKLSGIGETGFHPYLWYRRTFTRPAGEGRWLIHFGAVDYSATVWVNGHCVARHEGGHTPFSADITPYLVEGEQVVVVRAVDQPEDVSQPRGKQDWQATPHAIWYNRTSGIWQTVWLERVPETYVTDLQLIPDLVTGSVRVELLLNRPVRGKLEMRLSKTAGSGAQSKAIVEGARTLDGEEIAHAQVGVYGDSVDAVVPISAVQNGVHRGDLFWTPDNPNLIDIKLRLETADGSVDVIDSYFGLRSVGISHGRFLLNDRPLFVRSVLEQGYWPDSHLTAPSPDALREEVELIRSLGFNAVRIHQKVEDPHFMYWADHLGLMVWGEMANAYAFNAGAVDRFTREWLSAVKRDRSHPCIVTWVPLNESWGVADISLRQDQQDYATALYYLTKAIDPTRPVVSNDGWEHTVSDILSIHDYTQFASYLTERYGTKEALEKTLTEMRPTRKRLLLNPEDRRDQPVMLTEFGGLSLFPKTGEAWFGYATAEGDEQYLDMLKSLFDAIYESTDLAGFCYTQLTDTLQETNGLYDENRQPKLPLDRLRDIIWRPSEAVPSEHLDIVRQKALRTSFGQVV